MLNLALVIPTYNERDNIKLIIPEIFNILKDNVSIYVVDDNSPDHTGQEVIKMQSQFSNLFLIKRLKKEGLGSAYKDALSQVLNKNIYDAIIMMDADGSHDPKYLEDMRNKLSNFDVVIGSRYTKGGGIERWELWRKSLSYFGNLYARLLIGAPIKDMTAGFIGINTRTLTNINLNQVSASGYAFLMELKFMLSRETKLISEIPIIFKERREGESKISSQIISEGIVTPLRLFQKRLWRR